MRRRLLHSPEFLLPGTKAVRPHTVRGQERVLPRREAVCRWLLRGRGRMLPRGVDVRRRLVRGARPVLSERAGVPRRQLRLRGRVLLRMKSSALASRHASLRMNAALTRYAATAAALTPRSTSAAATRSAGRTPRAAVTTAARIPTGVAVAPAALAEWGYCRCSQQTCGSFPSGLAANARSARREPAGRTAHR